MPPQPSRRSFLAATGSVLLTSPASIFGRVEQLSVKQLVLGQAEAAKVGNSVLAEGGNAVDAMVAGALAAGVVAVQLTGIGGYGGHLVIAGLPGGKTAAIDFNTAAPAELREDAFQANEKGDVPGQINTFGWQAVGVPGVLAGLQLALDRYGTRKFADLVKPAIRYAREGFLISKQLASAIKSAEKRLRTDPGSAKLFLPNGSLLGEGAKYQNPDLARLLETLAEAGNVTPFYKGKIAEAIVAPCRKNGGLLTAEDFAKYEAHEVAPLTLEWNGLTIHTPPPTAGGLTVLQTLQILKELQWPNRVVSREVELVEALRVAWTDRFRFLGDPAARDVPIRRLLSQEYARETAAKIRRSVADGKPLEGSSDGRSATGTTHLNAIDSNGLAVALTFTHGGYFGSQVTVDGLGLILGHGLSRFDPRVGRANSPGPGKRPLHNMCPTIVTLDGAVVLAFGAIGGRKIVNAVTNVLAVRVGENKSLEEAVKAPRVHTEGDLTLSADESFGAKEILIKRGYTIAKGQVALLNALERVADGTIQAAAR